MRYAEEKATVLRAARWAIKASEAVSRVGGSPSVLDNLSDDMIFTMVNNGLEITARARS